MREKVLAFLAAGCLVLAGCHLAYQQAPAPEEDSEPPAATLIPPAVMEEYQPVEPQPVVLDRLTVEVAVDWSEADRILSQLDELSRLAGEALAEKGCTAEEQITITIGTAGGITAQALSDGGVDAAILLTSDYKEIEGSASAVLHSADDDITVAVTLAREELDENFQAILSAALLETDAGKEFLEICYPGVLFTGMNAEMTEQFFPVNP
ncbi:MAG: hypothetical protein HDT15_03065 [Oscillibacter sp.]|nr:hypothetical protein [Oscillibacter sp.]